MLRLILHQIWNQRRQNLWIWLELAAPGPSEVEHGSLRKIDAVFADIRHFDYQTPYPAIFCLQRDWGLPVDRFGVMVRVKEGVDGDRFMKDIQQDVLRHCCVSRQAVHGDPAEAADEYLIHLGRWSSMW